MNNYKFETIEKHVLCKEGFPNITIRKINFYGDVYWESLAYTYPDGSERWQKLNPEFWTEELIRENVAKYEVVL